MARITVEDCLGEDRFSNHFDLVNFAAKRAKQLADGIKTTLPPEAYDSKEKPAVTALREIAAAVMSPEIYDQEAERLQMLSAEGQEAFSHQALATRQWTDAPISRPSDPD